MGRTKKPEEDVRAEIILTAQAIFQKYGFSKTTMEDIAKSMKKGKSTLYYYFSCKDDVVAEVIKKEIADLHRSVKISLIGLKTATEKLRTFFDTTIKEIKTKVNLYGTLRDEALNNKLDYNVFRNEVFSNSINSPTIEFYESIMRSLLSDILLQGVEDKEFTFIKKEDIELVSTVMMVSLSGFVINITLLDDDFMFTSSVSLMLDILIKGLS